MLGLWNYSKASPNEKYGDDDVTYKKGMSFLADCAIVEDWGCGTGYAKRFCKGLYRGVDGSKGPLTEIVTDLREYHSQVDGIFMRHVLEHNHDWKKIFDNAIASFTRKYALIIFTPFSSTTKQIATNWSDIPDLSFSKEDITQYLKDFHVVEEDLVTKTQYGMEFIFYITRRQ
jgi:hypothetical protein